MHKYLILWASVLMVACSSVDGDECVEAPADASPIAVAMEDLRPAIASIRSKQQLVQFFTAHPTLRDHVFLRGQYPDDSAFINTVYQRVTNPYFDSLLTETQRVFNDLKPLEGELNEAFTNLHAYYPELPIPTIQLVATGMETDLFVSDTLIVVGVDFYLGPDARYRPNMYDYILRQYVPENIVPSLMLLYGIDGKVNVTNLEDRTVLADMIAYGKAFHFAKHMLPCKPDSVFINYSRADIEGARENQSLIWYRLVEDKVLYSTSNQLKQRYLSERPKTIEVGPECPGRIAQWVGWQIVDSYRKNHPDVSLQQLMQTDDADQLFKQSKYKANRK